MLHPDKSTQALPAAFGDFLGGMDSIGNKSTFDTFPTILDLDVPAPYQLKDVPRQIHKGLSWKNREDPWTISFLSVFIFLFSETHS